MSKALTRMKRTETRPDLQLHTHAIAVVILEFSQDLLFLADESADDAIANESLEKDLRYND